MIRDPGPSPGVLPYDTPLAINMPSANSEHPGSRMESRARNARSLWVDLRKRDRAWDVGGISHGPGAR